MNLFELAAVLTLNKSSYDKGIKDAEKSANSMGAKVGAGLKAAGAMATKIVAVGATAIGALVKQSVQAYGAYEQLRGGAEKIFEGMDFSKIQKDADNAYKELNMSASQYLESINLAGATFAKTMGTEKGYDIARKGMMSIADYASGTGKNIEELTAKYQMITRSAGSYLSIADQFSGILPQTTADFVAQARAAGYLSQDYKKITEIPVAEYQEAITNMLYDGVAALNLTSNTAKEATGTLTGSFATVRAAWQNLVVGIGDPKADIGQLVNNMVDAAAAALKNLLPTIKRVLGNIPHVIEELVPHISEFLNDLIANELPSFSATIVQLISALATLLVDNSDVILNAVFSIANGLLSAITENADKLTDAAMKVIDVIVGYFSDPSGMMKLVNIGLDMILKLADGIIAAAPAILSAVLTIAGSLMDKLTEIAPQIIEMAVGFVEKLASALIDPEALTNILNSALTLIVSLGQGLMEALPKLIPVITNIITSLVGWLTEPKTLSSIINAAIDLMGALVTGLINSIAEILPAITQIFYAIVDAFLDPELLMELVGVSLHLMKVTAEGLIEAIPAILGVIPDIIFAIVNGFLDHWEDLKDAAKKMIDFFTQGISSKVKEVKNWGKNLIDGFIGGIMEKWEALKSKVTGIVDKVKGIFTGKQGFDEHSPSRWGKQVFEQLLTGEEEGIERRKPNLLKTTKKLVDEVKDTFNTNYDGSGYSVSTYSSGSSNDIYALLLQYLPMLAQLKVYLDTGVLVGELTPGIDAELGMRAQYAKRGATV